MARSTAPVCKLTCPHVPQLDVPYVAPTTPAEIRLAQVWREVLGVDQIGLQDNFFDLGGDSFSAYRLMARLSDELERDLPLEAIFRTQTIAAMLGELERTVAGETGGGGGRSCAGMRREPQRTSWHTSPVWSLSRQASRGCRRSSAPIRRVAMCSAFRHWRRHWARIGRSTASSRPVVCWAKPGSPRWR